MLADDVLEQAARWRSDGRGVGLATVVRTWGSSPRPAGSQLVVCDDGNFVGSVSGGCIEGAVVREALAAIADAQPRLLDYGVTDDRAWEVGLACGGHVQVFVERAPFEVLEQVRSDRAAKRAAVLATTLPEGAHRVLYAETDEVARMALARDEAITSDATFYQPFNPPLRMILVGAVHVAQALAPMAVLAGFAVVVVDPRTAFASAARFPGVQLDGEWPGRALAALAPDARTAVVTLTHDPKLDDPALIAALRSTAFYVGCLGSGKTHAARVERLRGQGFGDADVARLHGPIGLPINARSPAEIAVSILAEVIQVLRPAKLSELTLFTFGYWGWGASTQLLLDGTAAVERERGFGAPLFVDIRVSRSVRAEGFREHAFERLAGPAAYVWMPALGNQRVVERQTGMAIVDPAAAETLLDLAIARAVERQRIIFYCACEFPGTSAAPLCHRRLVADLVLAAARGRRVAIHEWPGGAPDSLVVHVAKPVLAKLRRGGKSLETDLPSSRAMGLPWGSLVTARCGDDSHAFVSGPARASRGKLVLPVLAADGAEWRAMNKALDVD